MKWLIILIMGILLSSSVLGYATNIIKVPATFSTSSTLKVNITFGINATVLNGNTTRLIQPDGTPMRAVDDVNYTILNRSSFNGAYGILDKTIDLSLKPSNNTFEVFTNFTMTLTNGRHWLKINYTNATEGGELSNEIIIDVDTDLFKLTLGGNINFTLDVGNLTRAGACNTGNSNYTTRRQDGTKVHCGVNNQNAFSCVST